MKRTFLHFSLIIASLFVISSCGKKSGSTGLLIPEDAAIVIHVNNASLASKLSWSEIQQSNWYKEIAREASKDSIAEQLMKDPEITGVDAKADFVFLIKKVGKKGFFAFEGSLKDRAKYAAYLKTVKPEMTEQKDGEISSTVIGESLVLSWNNSHFILIGDSPMPDMAAMTGKGRNPYGNNDPSNKVSDDSLRMYAKQLFTLKSDDRLDQDSRFVSLIKSGKDINFWMNTGLYYKGMLGPMMSMMGNMSALLDDNISATSFDFTNGKITMDTKQYYGEQLTKLFKEYKSKNLDADLYNRIPSQNVIGAIGMNYPPEGIKQFLKVTGFEGLVGMAIAESGYTIDEFVKANKGDLLFAMSDLTLTQKIDTNKMNGSIMLDTNSKPDAKFLFATSVNDKGAFEKLITILGDVGKGMKTSNIEYKIEKDWFALSNSPDHLNSFLSGNNGGKSPYADKISGHPIGMFVDLQKIFAVAVKDVKDTAAAKGLDVAIKTWSDVIAYGGEFKDKAFEFHAEANMVDKNTNSLKQLNSFIDQIYTIAGPKLREKKMEWQNGPVADTAATAEIQEGVKVN